jgi:hypothetical protein
MISSNVVFSPAPRYNELNNGKKFRNSAQTQRSTAFRQNTKEEYYAEVS